MQFERRKASSGPGSGRRAGMPLTTYIRPFERFFVPADVDGSRDLDCRSQEPSHTQRTYRKEAKRLLLLAITHKASDEADSHVLSAGQWERLLKLQTR